MKQDRKIKLGTQQVDMQRVVSALEARHGCWAASVARFCAEISAQNGRFGQSRSWLTVCEQIEARTVARLDLPDGGPLDQSRMH